MVSTESVARFMGTGEGHIGIFIFENNASMKIPTTTRVNLFNIRKEPVLKNASSTKEFLIPILIMYDFFLEIYFLFPNLNFSKVQVDIKHIQKQ